MLDFKQREPATENLIPKCDEINKEETVHQECPGITINTGSEKEEVNKRGTEGKRKYEDVYRSGNFGVTLGRINTTVGKKWMLFHAITSSLTFILTISGNILLAKYYTIILLSDYTIFATWFVSVLSLIATVIGFYLFSNLETIGCPYRMLIILRALSTATLFFILCTIPNIVGIIFDPKLQVGFIDEAAAIAIKTNYGLILILFVFCIVSNYVILTYWSGWFCGKCNIYIEGEELAPGVLDPPSNKKFRLIV